MNFYDAFISYGRPDSKAFAINLNEKLTAAGLNVWFDQNDIPQQWIIKNKLMMA